MIRFQDVKITDRQLIQSYTLFGERQNCDLSFVNIISWRFLYNTEFAIVDDFLAFRFYTGNHLAYMAPLWAGDWSAEKQKRLCKRCEKDARRLNGFRASVSDAWCLWQDD